MSLFNHPPRTSEGQTRLVNEVVFARTTCSTKPDGSDLCETCRQHPCLEDSPHYEMVGKLELCHGGVVRVKGQYDDRIVAQYEADPEIDVKYLPLD